MKFNRRLVYFLSIIFLLSLGLFVFYGALLLPKFIRFYGGDVLIAALFYYCFAFLFIEKSALVIAVITLIFTFSVEFFQLVKIQQLEPFRQSVAGQLTIGSTFDTIDLLCYVVGISMAFTFDRLQIRW